jgi:hypothetical protein
MTDQERLAAFRAEFEVLRNKYGLDYVADTDTQVVQTPRGKRVETVPIMTIQPVPDWQPPADIESDNESAPQPNRHERRKETALNGK